jgi:WD40 repeat protein
VAFSPDGKQVVSGSEDSIVRLWDAATGAALQTLECHSGDVTSVAFSPDGKQVVSGSWDSTVQLWDAATGAALQTLKGHSGAVTLVAFSPDGKLLPTLHAVSQWLTDSMTDILWLPTDYRRNDYQPNNYGPTCEAIWGRIIVLGHSSGRISFLQIQQGLKLVT